MNILLTAISLVALLGCFLAVTRSERNESTSKEHADRAERARAELLEDRHRITGVERDVAAVRRELRKLSGKFYADLKAREGDDEDENLDELTDWTAGRVRDRAPHPVCQNWIDAKQGGPTSEAARCECLYCLDQRHRRAQLRAELVPRTVQGQAEVAKLNASKP